jgi:hypothetical protein
MGYGDPMNGGYAAYGSIGNYTLVSCNTRQQSIRVSASLLHILACMAGGGRDFTENDLGGYC